MAYTNKKTNCSALNVFARIVTHIIEKNTITIKSRAYFATARINLMPFNAVLAVIETAIMFPRIDVSNPNLSAIRGTSVADKIRHVPISQSL